MGVNDFKFVELAEDVEKLFGSRDADGRTRRFRGCVKDFPGWFDNLVKHVGPVMTPGEACLYLNISRPTMYERIAQGRVSAFYFEFDQDEDAMARRTREKAVISIPYSECEGWKKVRSGRFNEEMMRENLELEEKLNKAQEELDRLRTNMWREDMYRLWAEDNRDTSPDDYIPSDKELEEFQRRLESED